MSEIVDGMHRPEGEEVEDRVQSLLGADLARSDVLKAGAGLLALPALAALLGGCGSGSPTPAAAQPAAQRIPQSKSVPFIVRLGHGTRYIFTSELITFLVRGPAFTAFEDEARGGYGGPPAHVHLRQDEGFLVQEGEITFHGGPHLSHKIVGHPGDYIHIPKGTLHTWAVSSRTNGKVLTIFAPPGDFEGLIVAAGVRVPDSVTQPPPLQPPTKAEIKKLVKGAQQNFVVLYPNLKPQPV